MKKPIIILTAALILAGGSTGAFLAVKHKQDQEKSASQAQKADNVLFTINSDSISKLEFDLSDGEYVAEKGEDGVWKLTNRAAFELDQVYMQLICTYTSELIAEDSYGKADDSKKAMYGLDDPLTIKMTDDSRTYELYLGNESPTGEFYYAMTGDKENVYAIDSYEGSALFADRLTLKNKKLVPYGINDISKITIKNDGKETCTISYDDATSFWKLDKKYDSLTTDQTAITAMINELVRTEAEDLMDENFTDLAKYGLDKPDGEVIIEGKDGTKRTFTTVTNENDPNYSYVLIGEDKQLEIYLTSSMEVAVSTPFDYISHTLKAADMYSIKGFDIEIDGKNNEFTIDTDSKTCTMNGKSLDISNSEGYMLFQNFYDSFSMMAIDGLDIDAKPDDSKTVVKVTYHNSDDTDSELSIAQDGDKYYIFKDGKYTGAYAPADRFSGRTSINEFYKKLAAYAI